MKIIERDNKKELLKVELTQDNYRLIFRALSYYERHMEADSKDMMASSEYRGIKKHDGELARILINKMG